MGPSRLGAPDVQIVVDNVHVRYRVSSSDHDARRRTAGPRRALNRLLGRENSVMVRALAGVSLVARSGEAVGLVGLNGSGKSTLMRIMAGLERPHRGQVHAANPPVLLGVSGALVPELSGRANVRLGCLAMGLTPEQADAAYPDVVEVAGIGKAMHYPMKGYSSGMAARLKFAIAAASNPHVLLIDEALSTGDAAFRERSERRMQQLRASAGCLFLVSHAAKTIEENCTRALWLHRGHAVIDGDAADVAEKYRFWAWNIAKGNLDTAAELLSAAFLEGGETRVRLTPGTPADAPPRHARASS